MYKPKKQPKKEKSFLPKGKEDYVFGNKFRKKCKIGK
jgi:hypothetical protein